MTKKNNILVASAVAIMLAPAALSALPSQTVSASAVGTVTNATPVYNANGKVTGVTLPSGSKWQLGQQITLNGVAHYQIGGNEYIPASSVSNVIGSANPEDTTHTNDHYVTDNSDAGKTVTAKQTLDIVDAYGNTTGRTLPAGSRWVIGNVLHANKQVYYQVGTNEYISTLDVTLDGENTTDTSTSVSTDSNSGKIATINQTANVYNDNGAATGYVLRQGSQWKIGQVMKKNGLTLYQVGNNEWISLNDITITATTDVSGNGSYITTGSTVAGKVGTMNTAANIVNGHGDPIGTQLPAGSKWTLGTEELHYDKQVFYQVATDEFVSDAYITVDDAASNNTNTNTNTNSGIPLPGNGLIGTTTVAQKTYNTETNAYDLSLPANSAWKIDKLVVNKYGSYWGEIGTNQWVWISSVRLNSGLNLKNNSYYEPDFATNINK